MTETKRIISFVYDSTTGNIINIRNNTTVGKYVDNSILMKNQLLKSIMLNICCDNTSIWSDKTVIRVSENMPDSLKKSICNITHALSYEYEEAKLHTPIIIDNMDLDNSEYAHVIIYNGYDTKYRINLMYRRQNIRLYKESIPDAMYDIVNLMSNIASIKPVQLCIDFGRDVDFIDNFIDIGAIINMIHECWNDVMKTVESCSRYSWTCVSVPNRVITDKIEKMEEKENE